MKISVVLAAFATALTYASPMDMETSDNLNFLEARAKATGETCAAIPNRAVTRTAQCGVMGTVTGDKCINVLHIEQQHCADKCVCYASTCKSYSWNPDTQGDSRGHCKLYTSHLEDNGFKAGSPKRPDRVFYDRNCYHKGKATKTYGGGVHTKAPVYPTQPASYGKRAALDNLVEKAMAGI